MADMSKEQYAMVSTSYALIDGTSPHLNMIDGEMVIGAALGITAL